MVITAVTQLAEKAPGNNHTVATELKTWTLKTWTAELEHGIVAIRVAALKRGVVATLVVVEAAGRHNAARQYPRPGTPA